MSPKTLRLKPVAVTMMSASSSSPLLSVTPHSVKASISSVTIDACPSLIDLNRSPSGRNAIRWRHGM